MTCLHCFMYDFFDSSFLEKTEVSKCTCVIAEKNYVKYVQMTVKNLGLTIFTEKPLCASVPSIQKLIREIVYQNELMELRESQDLMSLIENYKKTYVFEYLDVGCSNGFRMTLLKQNYKCNVYGCDVGDVYSISPTKEDPSENITAKQSCVFRKIICDKINFPANYFHVITCINFFNKLSKKSLDSICKELYRVLHIKGILIIKEYDCTNYKMYFNLSCGFEFLRRCGIVKKNPEQFINARYVKSYLYQLGFKIIYSQKPDDLYNYTLILKK